MKSPHFRIHGKGLCFGQLVGFETLFEKTYNLGNFKSKDHEVHD